MKHILNEMTQEEKQKILNMHYGNNSQQLDEQKLFSGLKAGMRGFGQRLKTGFQNAAGSFATQGGSNMKQSAGLNKDVAIVQSRTKDLASTIQPLIGEIAQIGAKLQGNPSLYGQGYEGVQAEFMGQLNELIKNLNVTVQGLTAMSSYQPNYQQQSQQAPQQSTGSTENQTVQGGGYHQ